VPQGGCNAGHVAHQCEWTDWWYQDWRLPELQWPCKFAGDTKLCVASRTPEGWDTSQRDLDRLKQVNFMRFNKCASKVFCLGCGNSVQAGGYKDGAQPFWKGLGDTGGWQLDMNQQCALSSESQLCSGLHQNKCRERWSCPSTLCWWDLTWSAVSQCGILNTGETRSY